MKVIGARVRILWRVRCGGLVLSFLAAGGCVSSQVPLLVRQPLPENPSISAVREDISHYEGSYVRWGGTIARVENKKDHTVLEIVARELGDEGRPKGTDFSPGRFLARVDDFLDPAIYQEGRKITVYGVIEGLVEDHIGKHPYKFPVVRARIYHLWKRENVGRYYYPPYYFYYPPYSFYPYGFYPYGFYPFYYW